HDALRVAAVGNPSVAQPEDVVAHLLDEAEAVGDEEDRLPRRRNSPILSRHLRVKASSPTARTSSMRRTSGSTWMATAKPSRMYMPEEYVFTGASMKRSSSAKATISSKRSSTCRRLSPSMMPLMATFSRRELSGW